jgi:hypothetical protein
MTVRQRALEAALRICRARGGWTFRPAEIVAVLPDVNAGSVRTHVMSRCCVNAPAHHSHRWPYFRRVRRGVYEIVRAQRERPAPKVIEASVGYAAPRGQAADAGTRVEVREQAGRYIARVPGAPDEIRATTLDGLANRLRRIARARIYHSELPAGPLRLRIDLDVQAPDPVVEVFEKGVDRTQIRRNLRRSPEQRLLDLQQWIDAMDEVRGAAAKAEPEPKE